VVNPGPEVRSCGNAILLNHHDNHHHNGKVFITIIIPLLCYIVKYFLYIPPILVAWRRTASQTGALIRHWHSYFHYLPPRDGIVVALCIKRLPRNKRWMDMDRFTQNKTDYVHLAKGYDTEKLRKLDTLNNFILKINYFMIEVTYGLF
jgi:hypothetical protein